MEIRKSRLDGALTITSIIQVDDENPLQCHGNCKKLNFYDNASPYCRRYGIKLTEVDMGQYYKSERCYQCLTDFGVKNENK